jgi:hypothetical protein
MQPGYEVFGHALRTGPGQLMSSSAPCSNPLDEVRYPGHAGRPMGGRTLDTRRESIIAHEIETLYLKAERHRDPGAELENN